MKQRSLTSQLMKSVGFLMVAAILLVGAAAYFSARDEISEVYDSQLITSANVLWLLNRDDDITRTEIALPSQDANLSARDQKALDEYAQWRAFRLWKQGKLVVYSENARDKSVPPAPKGFTDIILQGDHWRVFTLTIPKDDIVVEVAEKERARTEIARNIVYDLLVPLLLGLPLMLLFVWKGIRWGLKDLKHFATTIARRSADDLTTVNTHDTPAEIVPLADSVNQLLTKLDVSLAQERLFTDNAAHELRTPLATLDIQADVILNSKDGAEREHTVRELTKGVRRASRLLDQLLTLARVRQQPIHAATLNLYQLAREAIKHVYPNALKKQIELSLSGNETLEIFSKEPLLFTLLINLLDNAIKYSPKDGAVNVCIASDHDMPMIYIEDNGPGIPLEERENVFKRFYRLSGSTEVGSGLGLAIVRSIAEILNVQVELYTPENNIGLGVRLVVP